MEGGCEEVHQRRSLNRRLQGKELKGLVVSSRGWVFSSPIDVKAVSDVEDDVDSAWFCSTTTSTGSGEVVLLGMAQTRRKEWNQHGYCHIHVSEKMNLHQPNVFKIYIMTIKWLTTIARTRTGGYHGLGSKHPRKVGDHLKTLEPGREHYRLTYIFHIWTHCYHLSF